METLSPLMELPVAAVQRILSRLMDKRLLTELDGFYISLALRPRDELIHNYVASTKHATSPVRDHSAPRVIRELAVLAQ